MTLAGQLAALNGPRVGSLTHAERLLRQASSGLGFRLGLGDDRGLGLTAADLARLVRDAYTGSR